MRPLRLTLQAFGPFARRQTIDFGLLGDKTFFLIHGPTGSGKTSILDGLCFALFGDSSGDDRKSEHMRSHHADDDLLTEVTLDFALGDKHYRVHRVPEQMRKAKRGGGLTKQDKDAELWRLGQGDDSLQPDGKPITTGWTKVTAAMVELLGFESAQFRQVIVLPQGKFFDFLKSSTQERERILQTLFGTELYKRIEEALKRSADLLQREGEAVQVQRKALLDQARAESAEALDTRRQQQHHELATRRLAEQTSATAALAAEARLAEARRVADRFAELDKSGVDLQTLRADQPRRDVDKARLDAARRAATLVPIDQALAEVEHQLRAEDQRARLAATDLTTAQQLVQTSAATLARETARAGEKDVLVARIAELDALKAKVETLAAARAETATAGKRHELALAAQKAARLSVTTGAQTLQDLVTRQQALRLQGAGLEAHRLTLTQLQTRLASARALAGCLHDLATGAKLLVTRQTAQAQAVTALAEATTRRDATRRDWIQGQAARLALALAQGQPCPVCGATDHPTLARHDAVLVGDDALQSAEDALVRAQAALRSADQQLGQCQSDQCALEARITEIRQGLAATGGADQTDPSLDELSVQIKAAQAALTQADTAVAALAGVDAQINAAQARAQADELAALAADTAAQQAGATLQELAGRLQERIAAVPADLAEPRTLESARAAAVSARDALIRAFDAATVAAQQAGQRQAEAGARLEASTQACARLASQQQEKAAQFAAELLAAGFVDAAACRDARLETAILDALAASLLAFDKQLAAAVDRQARAAAQTHELARPDLASAISTHDEAKAALLAVSKAVRDAVAALDDTNRFLATLQQLQQQFAQLEARYTLHRQVANVATGDNPHRMSLQRYVLATLLEEVLAATTRRLTVMSRGRYSMQRKTGSGDRRAAAGLDLEIFDQYTGSSRGVATLSGGESFLASLALALGLSDVVQSYAGGIRLDAIFVDEGFGTLDPEALDFAIRTLEDLQQTGRLVGIISHVAELKEFIDARLELKATPQGSEAVFVL
ncbi:MAG: SMC family ATPase [Burkholderiales bacterium]|nr:SMC family ATPase [Burkholderiales bacterium]